MTHWIKAARGFSPGSRGSRKSGLISTFSKLTRARAATLPSDRPTYRRQFGFIDFPSATQQFRGGFPHRGSSPGARVKKQYSYGPIGAVRTWNGACLVYVAPAEMLKRRWCFEIESPRCKSVRSGGARGCSKEPLDSLKRGRLDSRAAALFSAEARFTLCYEFNQLGHSLI